MAIDFEGVPPMLEIREAISRGREPYIRAAEQLDVINSNAAQDLNHGRDSIPLAIAFSEINQAQIGGYLQPPLTDELADLALDVNAVFSKVNVDAQPETYDLHAGQSYNKLESARFLLRIIIDHGSKSVSPSVFVREQFDASAHKVAHSDPSFEASIRNARRRRAAVKGHGS